MGASEEVIVNGLDYLLCLFKLVKQRDDTQANLHTQLSDTHTV